MIPLSPVSFFFPFTGLLIFFFSPFPPSFQAAARSPGKLASFFSFFLFFFFGAATGGCSSFSLPSFSPRSPPLGVEGERGKKRDSLFFFFPFLGWYAQTSLLDLSWLFVSFFSKSPVFSSSLSFFSLLRGVRTPFPFLPPLPFFAFVGPPFFFFFFGWDGGATFRKLRCLPSFFGKISLFFFSSSPFFSFFFFQGRRRQPPRATANTNRLFTTAPSPFSLWYAPRPAADRRALFTPLLFFFFFPPPQTPSAGRWRKKNSAGLSPSPFERRTRSATPPFPLYFFFFLTWHKERRPPQPNAITPASSPFPFFFLFFFFPHHQGRSHIKVESRTSRQGSSPFSSPGQGPRFHPQFPFFSPPPNDGMKKGIRRMSGPTFPPCDLRIPPTIPISSFPPPFYRFSSAFKNGRRDPSGLIPTKF